MSKVFFGYASQPEINREALLDGVHAITATGVCEAKSWEDLNISGRVIIRRVLEEIDGSDACAFDVTTLNENVLFELGYAIARAKPLWILLDKTDIAAKHRWERFKLLKSIGYVPWENPEDIRTRFLNDRPDMKEHVLYDDLIEPNLGVKLPASIFYVPTYHNTGPARQIDRRLDRERFKGVRLISADPTESSLNTLTWYASKAYETDCTIVHFEAARRELADLHNPRSALVAGVAHGLDRPLLMLAEQDYSAPLDYEDLLQVYSSSRECALILDSWLESLDLNPRAGSRTTKIKLASELRTLRFGEHVAENELDDLTEYFVPTASFEDVIADRQALFVGRKGTGKTANMLQAAARLSEDARNLVVVIKPASYEFSSLLGLLDKLPVSLQQYSIEALWKFLLTSEISNKVVEVIEARSAWISHTEEERKLLEYVDSVSFGLREDFGARFERTVRSLEGLAGQTSEGEGRDFLNEALHSRAIARLRSLLGPVLKSRQRVAVLIDNLDKGWERSADLQLLARLLLGLLSAVGRLKVEFGKEDYWRERVSLTAATFLRSDIYSWVIAEAREPDKIPASIVRWDDTSTLLRVVEERYLAARPENTEPSELWDRFFCETVNGIPTREYLVSRVLPRPRDLIYLCNAAVGSATNRGRSRIEEDDIFSAEETYSQFAFESLLVENGITITQFRDVLFEFLGEPSLVDEAHVLDLIHRAQVPNDKSKQVFLRLRGVSFIGVELGPGRFDYSEVGQAMDRADVLARKFADEQGAPIRYRVHPAYRRYLEIDENESAEV